MFYVKLKCLKIAAVIFALCFLLTSCGKQNEPETHFVFLGNEENVTPERLKELEAKANDGDIYCMEFLGCYYLTCYRKCSEEYKDKGYEKAFYWFEKASEKGDLFARHFMGICFFYGDGTKKDLKKAISCFNSFHSEWDILDIMDKISFGTCNEACVLNSFDKRHKTTLKEYEKLADTGNADAAYALGCIYEYGGPDLKQDKKKSFNMFKKGAELGHDFSIFMMGWCYNDGIGVKEDACKAVDCYKKVKGDAYWNALESLGFCYLLGDGVLKDEKKTVSYFEKAAERDASAQGVLSRFFIRGKCVEKDLKKGLFYLKKAALQNEQRKIRVYLADVYLEGSLKDLNIKKDEKEGIKLLEKSAESGYTIAMYRLGMYHFKAENGKEAFKWFERGAYLDNVACQYHLGMCYLHSVGVSKDEKEAIKWFERAASNIKDYDMGEELNEKFRHAAREELSELSPASAFKVIFMLLKKAIDVLIRKP